MGIKYRVQEWTADRFKRAQYPRATLIREKNRPTADFGTILTLFVVGSAATIIGLLGLAFLFFFVLPAFFS